MSKVLIVSDSHGYTRELQVLRERHIDDVELMIHCGDSQLTPDDKHISGYLTVMGNCDFGGFPLETITEVSGRRIFVTHGHKYSVKTSLMTLKCKAEEVNADIICFGHSHVIVAEMVGGKLFLNPGSIRMPRERLEKTYMILELQNDIINLQIFDLSGKELPELALQFRLPK